MRPNLDLDQVHADQHVEPLTVLLAGHRWQLPPVLSLTAARAVEEFLAGACWAQLDRVMELLFGECADEAAALLTPSDLPLILGEYGIASSQSAARAAELAAAVAAEAAPWWWAHVAGLVKNGD